MRIIAALIGMLTLTAADMPSNFVPWKNTFDFPAAGSGFDVSRLNAYDIDKNGFVSVKDGHFATAAGRIRFWAVNLTFQAMFPDHATAVALAAHLARLGVNCVRVHHIDSKSDRPGWSMWGQYRETQERFDDAMMDRMDFFIAELKKRGIYINMNLHVSRVYPSTKDYDYRAVIASNRSLSYGKAIDMFMPELIAMQKEFAHALLSHVNPYLGRAYKDDPVMAMVEINNENSFLRQGVASKAIDTLPVSFRNVLRDRLRASLAARYSTYEKLAAAWNEERTALGDEVAPMTFTPELWSSEVSVPAAGTIVMNTTIEMTRTGTPTKYFQTYRTGFSLTKGEQYVVILEAKGSPGSVIGVNVMRMGPPYGDLGLRTSIALGAKDYAEYHLGFTASDDANKYARLTLSSVSGTTISVRSVKLVKGTFIKPVLADAKSFDDVPLPLIADFPSLSSRVRLDVMAAMRDVEREYWKDMMQYVKGLGVNVPVTGTQVDFTMVDMSDLWDYVDLHKYWQHPQYAPQGGGTTVNTSMIPVASENTLTEAVGSGRVEGKPYTISEYDHAFPNEYCGEGVPFIAAISALQDYDAIFMFAFLFRFDLEAIDWFDQFNNIMKKQFYPFAAFVFRSGAVAPLAKGSVIDLGRDTSLANAVMGNFNPFRSMIPVEAYMTSRVALRMVESGDAPILEQVRRIAGAPDPRIRWTTSANYKDASFVFDDVKAKLFIG